MGTWKEYAGSISPGSTLSTCTLHCVEESLVEREDVAAEVWPASVLGNTTAVPTIAATPMIHAFHLLVEVLLNGSEQDAICAVCVRIADR